MDVKREIQKLHEEDHHASKILHSTAVNNDNLVFSVIRRGLSRHFMMEEDETSLLKPHGCDPEQDSCGADRTGSLSRVTFWDRFERKTGR